MLCEHLRFYRWKNNVIKVNTNFRIEGNFKYFESNLRNKYCINETTDTKQISFEKCMLLFGSEYISSGFLSKSTKTKCMKM